MANIKFHTGMDIPIELHKVRMVQKLNLQPVERRAAAIAEAGNNTFLPKNEDIFLDMLTDSGVNAMSDRQTAAMLICDDSYAGSASFTRLENKVHEIFGTKFLLPAHQGRACRGTGILVGAGVLRQPSALVSKKSKQRVHHPNLL